MSMAQPTLAEIVEAVLLAADRPLTPEQLQQLFDPPEQPSLSQLREALTRVGVAAEGRGYELKEVASGWRMQVRARFAPWVTRLAQEKPPRYSRALLETLALILYRQPITRAEIEAVRGVAVSSSIMKSLLEQGWIAVIGHREVPGRPAIYATTRQLLDHFNLKSLSELPPLAELVDLNVSHPQLELGELDPPTTPLTREHP
ncbi:MAG: SMC-Scp complex subunit ScpB [Pseudomonadales bacterium]|nr:SMC-Scp complex subunit ScpB [Pseudomonadales bacterium]MCC6529101.1 SMC-Scp complex subunit ScpB [Pseudomonadales bacterium]MCP5333996.1 SMC-Scp complex subunit ScpB [Pseudomonadales bacterium]